MVVLLLGLWLLYNLYAMGLIDASRAQGIALRVPLLTQAQRVGPLRLDPFELSLVGQRELSGAFDQVDALARQVDPNSVVIFSNNRDEPGLIATPLYFLHDRDALIARFNQPNGEKIAALIDGWRAQGREVILAYGTNGGKLALPRYALERVGDFALDVPQWAFAYQYMPRAAWRVNLNYTLYRAVPRTTAPAYPLTIDFAADDYPFLVNGFLERPTGAGTRWVGSIPGETGKAPGSLSAMLRLPSAGAEAVLDFRLRARAPQEGMRLMLRSGGASLGDVTLTREFSEYSFSLPRDHLKREGESFLVELATSAYRDAEGRVLGAELESASVNSQ